ncbi:MAG: hypothetical protein K6F30_08705 [Lachnospiraceae bacterium]|nr:hypothetical protein [Lachnospiraceae bacterium]
MTDRTVLKKVFQCSENGIDFIVNLDEDMFDEALRRTRNDKEVRTLDITVLEGIVINIKMMIIEKMEEMILEYGKDEDESDHAITVYGMCPYDDIRCEILPDDTPLIYLDNREDYERKFRDTIVSDLEVMTKIRFNER